MIKKPDNLNKIHVYLKDGREYLAKDIPVYPVTNDGKMLHFWDGDLFVVMPMENVDRIELYHYDTSISNTKKQ